MAEWPFVCVSFIENENQLTLAHCDDKALATVDAVGVYP